MRYWDTSAIVPLVVAEHSTELVRGWFAEDPQIATWWWSRVELVSAVERRVREGLIDRRRRRTLLDEFAELSRAWHEVIDLSGVRTIAERLLGRHPLRAADAGQLAAALVMVGEIPGLSFLCLDERLRVAAELEGLRLDDDVS